MKKKLLVRLALLLVVGVVLLGFAGAFLIGPASRAALEQGTQAALGVETHVGEVKTGLGLRETRVEVHEFRAANPAGMVGDPFLEVGSLSIGVSTMSVLSDTVRVPEIVLDGLDLRLIRDGDRSNVREILEHLKGLSADATSSEAPEPASTPESESAEGVDAASAGASLALGKIEVRGVRLSAIVRGVPGIELDESLDVPDFSIDMAKVAEASARRAGMSAEAGRASVADATEALVDQLVQRGLEAASERLSPEAIALFKEGLPDFEAKAKAKANAALDDAAEDAKSKLDKKLKGLLDK